MSDRRLVLCLVGLALAACELIVDFETEGSGEPTVRPTPIPQLDGAVAVIVDAQAIGDGTVVRIPVDASVDGGSDASRDGTVDIQDGSLDADVRDAGTIDADVVDADLLDGSASEEGGMDGSFELGDAAADGQIEPVPADGETPLPEVGSDI